MKTLSDRMAGYENVWRIYMPERIPVIMRIDGRSFSNYTSKLKRPIDESFVRVMNETATALCDEVQRDAVSIYSI